VPDRARPRRLQCEHAVELVLQTGSRSGSAQRSSAVRAHEEGVSTNSMPAPPTPSLSATRVNRDWPAKTKATMDLHACTIAELRVHLGFGLCASSIRARESGELLLVLRRRRTRATAPPSSSWPSKYAPSWTISAPALISPVTCPVGRISTVPGRRSCPSTARYCHLRRRQARRSRALSPRR